MASRGQCSRLRGDGGGGGAAALPADVLFEVLLRLAAKDVCRLRAVCRAWRAVACDAAFAATHAARHRATLLVGGVLDFESFPSVDVLLMDLSGNVVKRVRHSGTHLVLPTRLDLVCVTESYSCNAALLNPVTGAALPLPQGLSRAHAPRRQLSDFDGSFKYGRASNGDYKVLRVLTDHRNKQRPEQIFEILTLGEGGHARTPWRAIAALPLCVRTDAIGGAVVNGVVHFLLDGRPNGGAGDGDQPEPEMDSMALFDLKTEKWTSFLQGPITSYPELNSIDDILPEPQEMEVYQNLSMAELNNVLVVAQHTDYRDPKIDSFVDLWYLVDSDKDTWDRKHRIGLGKTAQDAEHYFPWVNPSLVLDDGRIVIYIHVARSNVQGQYTRRLVRLYDPETETLSSDLVDVRNIHSLGFFTGSLLGV
ncbi:F-box protein At5g65850-like [Oryza brachyantha]|uniref:F-box protein At5g65850-like n=1 Tax=Oryza brachyantha TaxID=4533 RepID=UPI001ADC9727|nr:F-box protein At5g65850-like [Oryza brachyantha]